MTESQPDIQSILAALASQRPPPPASNSTPPGLPGHGYPAPGPPGQGGYQLGIPPGPPPNFAGTGAPLPAPASSGNFDLSAIRPVNSGTMKFGDITTQARTFSAEGGPPYDGSAAYGSDRRNPRSRSRSPARQRDDRRGGQGRKQGRDRSYSPPPRDRPFSPRNGRERSPLRWDDNSETIQIESSLVGLIIGRQGENLRRIEAESKCRVQFLAATEGPFRQCRITGPAPRRAEVRAAVNRIIEDSGMGALNRIPDPARDQTGGSSASAPEGEDHMQIMVPDRTVGLIIGRGGETIRDLQERSGCHINIVGESKSVNGLRPVNLIGSVESSARAKDLILEIVDSDTRGEGPAAVKKASAGARIEPPMREPSGGGPNDKVNDSIYVPSDAVGMIIGRGGETIREMQNLTGCKINVAPSSGPGEVQREIGLIGPRDSIARAKQVIDEKVDSARQKGGINERPKPEVGGYGQPHAAAPIANTPSQAPAGDAADPYAQYGGYQNYITLWYQSLMYQQQQQSGERGAPAPGA